MGNDELWVRISSNVSLTKFCYLIVDVKFQRLGQGSTIDEEFAGLE